jgi:peptide/nickel transport system permease protein
LVLEFLLPLALWALVAITRTGGATARFISGTIMRSADVLQAFPVFVFAIAVVAVFGQSITSVVLAIAFVNTPIYLRLMRAQVLSIRRLRYVEAAYVAGLSDSYIIKRHIVPNAMGPAGAAVSQYWLVDPVDGRPEFYRRWGSCTNP